MLSTDSSMKSPKRLLAVFTLREAVQQVTVVRQSVQRQSVVRQAVVRQSMVRQSVERQSVVRQSVVSVTGKNSTATLVDTELYYSFNLQHTQRNSR